MLEKKDFLELFSDIEKIDQKIDDLIKIGFDINSDLISCLSDANHKLISCLEKFMNDKYETISWFIYENEYGKKKFTIEHTKGEKAGTTFYFNNVDDLYDYLKNYNNLV